MPSKLDMQKIYASQLNQAIIDYKLNLAEKLLDNKNFDINSKDVDGDSALHVAIKTDNEIMVRKLIAKEADIFVVNKEGQTALDLAYKSNKSAIVRILEAKVEKDFKFPLDIYDQNLLRQYINNFSLEMENGLEFDLTEQDFFNGCFFSHYFSIGNDRYKEFKENMMIALRCAKEKVSSEYVVAHQDRLKDFFSKIKLYSGYSEKQEELNLSDLQNFLIHNDLSKNILSNTSWFDYNEITVRSAIKDFEKYLHLNEKRLFNKQKEQFKKQWSYLLSIQLFNVVAANKVDNVEKLLQNPLTNIYVRNEEGKTALDLAVDNNYAEIAKLIFAKQIELAVNAKDGRELIRLLEKYDYNIGSMINIEDCYLNMLQKSVVMQDTDIVSELLEYIIDIKPSDLNKIINVATDDNIKVKLLQKQANTAILTNEPKLLRKIIESNPSLNINLDLINFAINNNYLDVVKILFKQVAKLDNQNLYYRNAFYNAIKNGYNEMIEFLLNNGAKIDLGVEVDCSAVNNKVKQHLYSAHKKEIELLLRKAIEDGELDKVKEYLNLSFGNQKIDIDAQDNKGTTLLHLAAGSGRKAIVLELLTRGAKINIENYKEHTAIDLADINNYGEIVKLLGDELKIRKEDQEKRMLGLAQTPGGEQILISKIYALSQDIDFRESYEFYVKLYDFYLAKSNNPYFIGLAEDKNKDEILIYIANRKLELALREENAMAVKESISCLNKYVPYHIMLNILDMLLQDQLEKQRPFNENTMNVIHNIALEIWDIAVNYGYKEKLEYLIEKNLLPNNFQPVDIAGLALLEGVQLEKEILSLADLKSSVEKFFLHNKIKFSNQKFMFDCNEKTVNLAIKDLENYLREHTELDKQVKQNLSIILTKLYNIQLFNLAQSVKNKDSETSKLLLSGLINFDITNDEGLTALDVAMKQDNWKVVENIFFAKLGFVFHTKNYSQANDLFKYFEFIYKKGDSLTVKQLNKLYGELVDNAIEARTIIDIEIVNLFLKNNDLFDPSLVKKMYEIWLNRVKNAINISDAGTLKQCLDLLLVNKKIHINSQYGDEGSTLLHLAASIGNIEIVKELLTRGAKINIENKNKKTAIDLANNNNNYDEMVKLLKERLATYQQNTESELLRLIDIEPSKIIEKLKTLEQDVDFHRNYSFYRELYKKAFSNINGNVEREVLSFIAEKQFELAKKETNIQVIKHSLVCLEKFKPFDEMLEILNSVLQEHDTDEEIKNFVIKKKWQIAVQHGYKEIADDLLKEKVILVDDNYFGLENSLLVAAQHDQLEIVELLLSNEAEVNHTSYTAGNNPLIWAVKVNNIRMVELLLNKGAIIHDIDNKKLLDIAIGNNCDPNIIQMLFEKYKETLPEGINAKVYPRVKDFLSCQAIGGFKQESNGEFTEYNYDNARQFSERKYAVLNLLRSDIKTGESEGAGFIDRYKDSIDFAKLDNGGIDNIEIVASILAQINQQLRLSIPQQDREKIIEIQEVLLNKQLLNIAKSSNLNKHQKIFNELLKNNKVDVFVQDNNNTALDLLLNKFEYGMAKQIFEQQLNLAVKQNNNNMVAQLLNKYASLLANNISIDDIYSNILITAAKQNNNKIVEELLRREHNFSLDIISKAVNASITPSKALLERQLYLAAKGNKDSIVENIINKYKKIININASYNHTNDTNALMIAAQKGNFKVVKKLLLAGASINLANSDNKTALYLAVKEDHPGVAELLLSNGAHVGTVIQIKELLDYLTENYVKDGDYIENNRYKNIIEYLVNKLPLERDKIMGTSLSLSFSYHEKQQNSTDSVKPSSHHHKPGDLHNR